MIGSLYYLIEQIKRQRITRKDIVNFRLSRYLEFNDITIPAASSKSNDKQRNEFFDRIKEIEQSSPISPNFALSSREYEEYYGGSKDV